MTGKDMLQGIQNVDTDLIEEAEFGTFRKNQAKLSRRRKLLLVLAAAMIMGTMTAAAAYTRWTNTMQFGGGISEPPSQQLKEQAHQSGLSVLPTQSKGQSVSATDQGVTVTLAQTVMDAYGGKIIFRIDGLKLEEGQAPWAWWDVKIDGKDFREAGFSMGASFFPGYTKDADGNLIYIQNGKSIPRVGKDNDLRLNYQLSDGSIEYCIDFTFPEDGPSPLGKEIAITFTGFGIQGEEFTDEDIMTVPGTWELRWTLEGSAQPPKTWTPNAKIGHWDVTLLEAEIGQFSMVSVYAIGDEYADMEDFRAKNHWAIGPAGFRLKDGTDVLEFAGGGRSSWDAKTRRYTVLTQSSGAIFDPEQIAGIYFFAGYEINDRGIREDKPYYYIPLTDTAK